MFNVRTTPDDAYRYAKGEPIDHPAGMQLRINGAPLDFLMVSDHARYLGVFAAQIEPDGQDAPAAISNAGLEERCSQCAEALEIFVEAYGAEAGNAALRTVATGGVFIGGGIAPQILLALTNGRFMQAFCDKGQMHELLARMPVRVIVNADAGLIGAAVSAVEMP